MSDSGEDANAERFEKLKGETLDLLGGIGGTWMSFDDIACEHEACDGEVDRDELLVALEELIEEGRIEHGERGGEDEYRWRALSIVESADEKVHRLEAENESLRRRIEELESALDEHRGSLL